MPPRHYRFTVIKKIEIAENILLISFKSPEKIFFNAGQYFSFKIDGKVHRSYSIASSPHEENVEFLIEVVSGGIGSTYMNNLKVGDELVALGPLGFFTLEKTKALQEETPLILIATGSGIAPMRSMVKYLLLDLKTKRKIALYFGLRYDDNAYFYQELKELDEKFENFTFTPVISRPSTNWTGIIGHCQDCIIQDPADLSARIYICGSSKSVEGISSDLIAHGYLKERVHFEKFG
jgi:CDP-4-dehydro-6-deoxyglucose reductase